MCVSQRRWMGCRGLCSPTLPLILLLLLLPLSFLSSTPPFAQGAIHIPKTYKQRNILQPPVLTETPKSHTVFSRDDLSLTCEATGNPTPTFRWVKDGEVLESESLGSGTLRVENTSLELLEGYYCCYASNSLGTAMTQTVKVIVESQPVLLKQHLIRKRAFKGQSIILSCNPPESSIPPSIHWMNMNLMHVARSERVTMGLDGNLYFANLEESDSKEDYICHAQYIEARTILPATAVALTVEQSNNVASGEKPRFFHPNGHHAKIMALRGHSLTLECLPKGLPTPKVEWKKKDGILENTTGQVTNFDRWLRFSSITQEDDGEYECKASNIHGFGTRSFTVTVEAAPYWVKEPQDLMYTPGETVRLDCQAEGIPKPTIMWRINGQLFTDVDEEPRRTVAGGTLIMRDVNMGDTAVYQCEATNVHGSILLNTYLYVVELPPQILTPDGVEYRVTEGGDVALHCESFGSPRPSITWEGEDKAPLLSDPRISPLINGTIKLSNVSHDDSGVYICSIVTSNMSITADLKVFNRTVILSGPQDVRARRGANVFLHCQFYIDPQLRRYQVVWKRDNRKLDESSLDDKYTILENSTLKVTDVQLNDTAQYSCEVITDLDHVNAQGSITVIARPDPPSDLSLSNIEGHSLTLSWITGPSHNSPITVFIIEAQVEYHTEEMKRKWEELKRVPSNFNHVELSLHPYSTYRFRVIAINEVGQSSPSVISDHHSTPPAAPTTNPTGVRSNSSEPGTLIITWDEMDKRSHNGQGFQYEVLWREADGSDVKWNSSRVKSPPFIVNNTGTYTPFEIKVRAVNALGGGPEPEPGIGHSGEDKPEEGPTGVSSTVMNSTVRVRWDKAQKVRGLLLGYKIYIERLGPQEDRSRRSLRKHHHEEDRGGKSERSRGREDSWVVEVDASKTSEEVKGLRLFSKYELTVTAFNSRGESPHSQPHEFSTPEGAPGPPASLSFESPTEKSLILYWTAPREINGILQGYTVQYQEVESKDNTIKMQPLSDPSVNYLRLDNLDPSSHYIFSVIAHTRAGVGPPITRRGATLLDGVPPSNITVMPGNTSVSLSWVPGVRNRNHGFHIHYLRKSGGSQWEVSEVVNSTQGSYTLTGLQPGADYHLKVMHGNSTQWEGEAKTVESLSVVRSKFATQGWLIGLISAIMLLVLILLILCLIKRSKGGKYAVKDKESKEVDSEARPMKEETFGEYRSLESDGDEKRSDSQQSLEESKMGSVDSLAEYGDSVDIQFNEDGSFIGQYSGRASAPHGNESSGPASPVNAVPPPPVAPSMSSILNRPS